MRNALVRHISSLSRSTVHPITASERLVDRKSTFLAHAARLPEPSLFPAFLAEVKDRPELKRATHCMYAYKCLNENVASSGQNDGGESGSGEYLYRLLSTCAVDNVAVVVSRWYGGTKLGSDRWRRISDVAREALLRGGLLKVNVEENLKKKKKKKRS